MTMLQIQKLKKSDMAAVYHLVKQLAIFEKSPEKVITSSEDYADLFDAGLFDGHVAYLEGKMVGMAIYYPIFSTWTGRLLYLEDFYVEPGHRGLGIGQQLFDAFLAEAKQSGCRGAKWQVLDWNTAAIRFYERNHAIIETEWLNGRIYF